LDGANKVVHALGLHPRPLLQDGLRGDELCGQNLEHGFENYYNALNSNNYKLNTTLFLVQSQVK
jgi:hypothetical protein